MLDREKGATWAQVAAPPRPAGEPTGTSNPQRDHSMRSAPAAPPAMSISTPRKGYGKGGIANQGIANGIVSTRINQFTTAERAHLPDTEHAMAARHDQQQQQEEREHDKSMIQELKRSLLEQKERDEYQMLQVQNEQHRILQESEAQHKLQLDEVVRGVESRAAEVAQRVAQQAAQAQGAAPTAAGSQGNPVPEDLK